MPGHSIKATCACCSLADKQHAPEQVNKEASFQAAKQFIAAVSAPAPSIDLVAIAPAPVDLAADVAEAPAPAGPQLPGTPFYHASHNFVQCSLIMSGIWHVYQASR